MESVGFKHSSPHNDHKPPQLYLLYYEKGTWIISCEHQYIPGLDHIPSTSCEHQYIPGPDHITSTYIPLLLPNGILFPHPIYYYSNPLLPNGILFPHPIYGCHCHAHLSGSIIIIAFLHSPITYYSTSYSQKHTNPTSHPIPTSHPMSIHVPSMGVDQWRVYLPISHTPHIISHHCHAQ